MNTETNKPLTVEEAARKWAIAPNHPQGSKIFIHRMHGFEAGAEWKGKTGGIIWLPITKDIDLPKDETCGDLNPLSVNVLLIDRHKNIVECYYKLNDQIWIDAYDQEEIDFKPTHYAIINYPNS